jgi:polyhydroxybutyrate depolymerase
MKSFSANRRFLASLACLVCLATAANAAPWRGGIRERIRQNRERRQPQPATQTSGMIQQTLRQGGIDRTYYLYTPANYRANQPAPLILGLHGGQSQATRFAETTNFNQLADRTGTLVAYPVGIDKNWNDGRNSDSLPQSDDVAFIRAVIDDIQRQRSVDPKKIYATGISNGGFMTQRLACELSDRITAFASVASTFAAPLQSTCKTGQPISMLMINGLQDRFVPVEGGTMTRGKGGTILSLQDSMDLWRDRAGCATNPQVTRRGQTVKIMNYPRCSGNVGVANVVISDGGHTWPGGFNQPRALVGKTSTQIDATQYIWDFFQSQP